MAITEKKLETLRKQLNRSANNHLRFEGRCEPNLRYLTDGFRIVYLEGNEWSIPNAAELNPRDLSSGAEQFLKEFESYDLAYEAIGKASEFTEIYKDSKLIRIAKNLYLNEQFFRQIVNFLGKDSLVFVSTKKQWQFVWIKSENGLAGILPCRILDEKKEA